MKFTLTTSFYNGEQFIDILYDKIKNQTYKNWEWVVTDDFSNDNGRSKLLQITKNDRRVKFVEQTKKKEMFWNPQKFCKDSDIIVQLDQDDYPLPKALEVYHHFFTKFPEVVLITCAGNMYTDGVLWKCFYNPDYRKVNNMSCGYLTFLRAWRNNPNINFDFNPNDWMKYFYNDLSIVCTLEEHGKILNLPRNLYFYSYRDNSISHNNYENIDDVRYENDVLINSIKNRRYNNNINTIVRYFDPIFEESNSLIDNLFNDKSEQVKFSFYVNDLTPYKEGLLKELFFDYDINFNTIDGDEDYIIYNIKKFDDVLSFLNLKNINLIKNKLLVINNFYSLPNEEVDSIMGVINKNYQYTFQIDIHMIITLLN